MTKSEVLEFLNKKVEKTFWSKEDDETFKHYYREGIDLFIVMDNHVKIIEFYDDYLESIKNVKFDDFKTEISKLYLGE